VAVPGMWLGAELSGVCTGRKKAAHKLKKVTATLSVDGVVIRYLKGHWYKRKKMIEVRELRLCLRACACASRWLTRQFRNSNGRPTWTRAWKRAIRSSCRSRLEDPTRLFCAWRHARRVLLRSGRDSALKQLARAASLRE
jgi:hypothetical protein